MMNMSNTMLVAQESYNMKPRRPPMKPQSQVNLLPYFTTQLTQQCQPQAIAIPPFLTLNPIAQPTITPAQLLNHLTPLVASATSNPNFFPRPQPQNNPTAVCNPSANLSGNLSSNGHTFQSALTPASATHPILHRNNSPKIATIQEINPNNSQSNPNPNSKAKLTLKPSFNECLYNGQKSNNGNTSHSHEAVLPSDDFSEFKLNVNAKSFIPKGMLETIMESDMESLDWYGPTERDEEGIERYSHFGMAVDFFDKPLKYNLSFLLQCQKEHCETPQVYPDATQDFIGMQHLPSDVIEHVSEIFCKTSNEQNTEEEDLTPSEALHKSIRMILNKVCPDNLQFCIHDMKEVLTSRNDIDSESWMKALKECLDNAAEVSIYVEQYSTLIKEILECLKSRNRKLGKQCRRKFLEYLQNEFEKQKDIASFSMAHACDNESQQSDIYESEENEVCSIVSNPSNYACNKEKDKLFGIVKMIASLYNNGFLKSQKLLFDGILYHLISPPNGNEIDIECIVILVHKCCHLFDFSQFLIHLRLAAKKQNHRSIAIVDDLLQSV